MTNKNNNNYYYHLELVEHSLNRGTWYIVSAFSQCGNRPFKEYW